MKKIKSVIIKFYNYINWKMQSSDVKKKEIISAHLDIKIEKNKRILIIAPHPDDELIGCFALISKYRNLVDIYYTGLTGYNKSKDNIIKRRKEIQKLCEKYNAGLYLDKAGEYKQLSLINFDNYQYIFIPSFIDWHWEHRNTCLNALKYIIEKKYCQNIMFYMVTVPIPAKYVNYYNEIGKDKWGAFKEIYLSQSFMPIDRFRAVERSYLLTNNSRIEPYYEIDADNCIDYINAFKTLNETELDEMYKSINNIKKIREKSIYYYNLVEKALNKNRKGE